MFSHLLVPLDLQRYRLARLDRHDALRIAAAKAEVRALGHSGELFGQ